MVKKSRNGITESIILDDAKIALQSLIGHKFNVLSISPPSDKEYARFLSKINSKLSSIIGNMIEEKMANHLNKQSNYTNIGEWIRQDPGFPDNIFNSYHLKSTPGIEVKAWLPFSTEITGRFKVSQRLLQNKGPTFLALVAWMPENILHGSPEILDILFEPAMNIAKSRDNHYFKPPQYILNEPIDTSNRTINLQQQNVEGYIFQGDDTQMDEAKKIISRLELDEIVYPPTDNLLMTLESLRKKYNYRLDTNFAKVDRINNEKIKKFKQEVLKLEKFNKPLSYWKNISKNDEVIENYINIFNINKNN